ncbi:3-hydroxyacyl-[acyl-carrier-protein] dehydratase, FabZ form [hydrothermal vent metagenome]|uniref:3-hydroxyacyl-[acyl-carrier-protein] dehydratase, FabZ form n=1 Tax=hydrothermal vent metagenome TaxID=652676 RepID=A0A3B1DES0_9ZZZZ
MRFALIDRITSIERGKSITAVKNVSMAEEYLADHFPGFPILPGVLMIETLVQAGAWLMRYSEDFKYSAVLLKQSKAVRFNNFVQPGKTLTVSLNVHKWDGNECTFKALGTVDGKSAVNARLVLEQFNVADAGDELIISEQYRIDEMKKMFHQIWTDDNN